MKNLDPFSLSIRSDMSGSGYEFGFVYSTGCFETNVSGFAFIWQVFNNASLTSSQGIVRLVTYRLALQKFDVGVVLLMR